MIKVAMMAVAGVLGLNLFTGAGDALNAQGGRFPERVRERIEVVSGLLGMEPREVARELRDGATIAELADTQGVDLATISTAIAEPRQERLAEEVAAGILTQEQTDYLNAQADERLNDFLTLPPRQAMRQRMLADFATAVGLNEADIRAQLEAGSTAAAIITAQGLDASAVIAEMVSLREVTLDERVALDLMTATQQRRALAAYEQLLTNRLAQ